MRYIYHYDIAAFFISLVILFNLFIKQRITTRVSRTFKYLAIDLFIAIIFDLITIFTICYPDSTTIWVNYLLNIIALISYNTLPAFYIACIVRATLNEEEAFPKKYKYLIFIPSIIVVLLILTTPLTKQVIYFDSNGHYHTGFLLDVLTVIGFIYLIIVSIFGILKRKTLRTEQAFIIFFYTVSTIFALAITNIFPSLQIILFVASLTVLITYLSLDNPSEYTDPIMDIYNKKAFMFKTASFFTTNKEFIILGIQIEGITYLNETLGYNNFNRLLIEIGKRLCGICGKHNVFRLSGSKLAITLNPDDKELDDKLLELQLLFSQAFKVSKMEVNPKVKLAMFHCPEAADHYVKLNDLIFDTLNSPATETGKIVDGNKKILEKSKREYMLVQILKDALSQNQFEVYYQPIYSIKKNKYTTAEALIRLNNTEFGFVSPEEFIPVAERNGLILMIGEYVFRSVCKFIIHNKIWEKGIEYIHVNLSVIQCMQEKMHEQLLSIMDYYGLEYKYIELEVTDTAAVVSSETLMRNMRYLIEKNMGFALDDYGMGYSNTSSILKYPFHTIKIDKSIIWSAMKDEKARKLLQHTIAMFRDMGIVLVAEGVETKEMASMLKKMKCDYLQGFLYSKPVTAEGFLKLL